MQKALVIKVSKVRFCPPHSHGVDFLNITVKIENNVYYS